MNMILKKLTSLFGAKDMTVGKPSIRIIEFTIPLIIGNFAQQLYSTVDSIIVGNYVGDNALAAVGASLPIFNMIIVLLVGISMGTSIMVAQYFGAKRKDELSYTVGTTITATLIASILIMAFGLTLSELVMKLLGTPIEILSDSVDYLIIILVGIAGMAYYNILAGVLRGLGDAVMPLLFLIVACLINIGLDLLFVAVFDWGVKGVGWATIIAQTISAVLCFIRLSKMKDILYINKDALKPRKFYFKQLLKLGIPSGLSQAIMSMSMILVQSVVNSFGPLLITANTVVMRVDGFAMMPNFSFGNAMTTYSGQNIGAGKLDRVKRGTKDGLVIGVLTSTTLTILILVFGENILHMFTDTQQVVDVGVSIFKILAVGYIAVSVTQVLQGVMRGSGDTMTPMIISLVAIVGLRLPLLYTLIHISKSDALPNGNYNMIFISLLTVWVFGAIVSALVYRVGKWQRKAIIVSKSKADGVN